VSRRDGWIGWAAAAGAETKRLGRWRSPRDLDGAGPEGKLAPDGRAVVSFASNDYLGLSQHPHVVAAAHAALDRWGTGSGSARLIVGSRPVHSELELALADWKQSERAVLFPTGFAANLGVLGTFGHRDARVFSDELNHASIIDGARLAAAPVSVYRHRDTEHLEQLLTEHSGPAIVVTDLVFSMDGDVAPIDAILAVCARYDVLLVLDEAHAVLGPGLPPTDVPIIRVGTLSKTLGSLGGFVTGPAPLVELLVNRARSYIFTTASTPADTAAAAAALEVLRGEEGRELTARLRMLVGRLRPGHPSPIVPIVCGDEQRALDAAAALLDRGMLVPAIRPPTVAPGTSRLRVALSAAHTVSQVDALREALEDLSPEDPVPTDAAAG
jgi:8-amino-7-oxononanoate synthase